MADLLRKVQDNADKARSKLAAKGLREHRVTLLVVQWIGKDATLGRKGDKAADAVALEPAPIVENVSVGLVAHGAGVIQTGDILVRKISRHPRYEALLKDPATLWLVEGPHLAGEYALVNGTLRMHRTEWTAVLRRRLQKRESDP